MKELQLGIISDKELADWFGVTASRFSHDKKNKLEQLKIFADYDLIGDKRKKVKIKKIHQPIYSKKGSKSFELIKSKLDDVWSVDGLDSCTRVCQEILETTQLGIADSTAYNYTIRSRNDLYGKPFQEAGSLGSCTYVWCKKDGETGQLRHLTQEEQKIKQNLIKVYFGDVSEKQIIVQAMIQAGEITQAQAWGVLTKMTKMKGVHFVTFLRELQRRIGCQVIRGTQVDRIEQKSAFKLQGEVK